MVINGNGIADRVFHILRGNVTITGVTIRGGNVRGSGGGVFNAGRLILENSTLVDSRATVSGGGLYNQGAATLANVTVVTNTAPSGSGLANGAGTPGPAEHALAYAQCTGTLTVASPAAASPAAAANNLAFAAAGCGGAATTSGDPRLQPQTVAGLTSGPAWFALAARSAAIDAGVGADPATGCPAVDRAGVARPQGARCDIGAVEFQNSPPIAQADTYAAGEDRPLAIVAPGVLANDGIRTAIP